MAQEEKYYIKLYPETFNKCVEKRVPWNQFIIDIEKSIVDGKTIVINQTTGKIEVYENYVASNVINPTDVIFGAKGDTKTKWTYELIRNTLRNYFQSIWDFENIHYYAGIQDRPVIGDINKLYVDTTTEEIFLYYTDAWHTFVASQGVQSNWEEDDQNLQSFIKNKPTKLSQFENDTNFITIGEVPPLPDDIVVDANYVHTDNNYTEGDKQKVDDLSGTNTGDQDLSGLVPRTQNILTKEPTGFSRNDSLVITANGDRTITLSGMVSASYRGDAVTEIVNGWVSPLHGTDTTKLYHLYYNGSSISWSENVFAFDLLQICIAKYDNTNARWYYFREAHGFMPWQDHFEFHNNIGTYKSSGGLIPTNSYVLKSTVASQRRIDVNETLIYDEDLPTVIPALTSKSYTQFALTGAGIDNIGLAKTDYINLSTNNPYYNRFTTSWVNTLVPTNSVFTVWDYVLPVTADPTSQEYRHLFVQPQWVTQASNSSAGAIATAVTAEKNRLPSELNLNGLLSTEIVAINRITLSYYSGNWRIESIDVLSGNKYSQIGSPSGNYLTSSHLPWASSGHTGTANKLMSTDASGNASETDFNSLLNLETDGSAVDISNSNLNDYRSTGFFRGNNLTNAPLGDTGHFHIHNQTHGGGTWCYQEAVAYGTGAVSKGEKYKRHSAALNNSWTAWIRVNDESIFPRDTFKTIISAVNAGASFVIAQGTGYKCISDIIVKCTAFSGGTSPGSINIKYYDVNNTQQTINCPVTTTVGSIHRVTSIVGISPMPSADLSKGAITVEWTKTGGAVTVHDYEIICKID